MNFKHIVNALSVLMLILIGCSTAEQSKEFKSMDDIEEANIGVVLGTTHDSYVTNEMPKATIIRLENEADMFVAIKQGKCDVILFDNSTLNHAKKQISGLVEIPNNLPPDGYGVGFHKNNTELHAQFNAFLKEINDNGVYKEMYNRWLNDSIEPEMPEIQSYTQGEPIRVAVSATLYPFAYVKNQEMVGLDIELSRRFAEKIKRPVVFQNINFGSLIASLQAGKSDMISSAMSITEERQKMVLFSNPYFKSYRVVTTISKNNAEEANPKDWWQRLKRSFTSNILMEKRYMLILDGLKNTVIISIFSLLLGTLLGGLICFMRMSKNTFISSIASGYISLMRGMPVLVLLMLMFYVFMAKLPVDGVQVAIITFAINFSAYVSEMFRSAIQGVERGQTEAGIALGFSPSKTFYHIIMPQALKSVLPVYKGEMISLIKMTSIVGYIAVEDLTKMSDIIRSRTFDAFFPLIMVAIIYFILAWLFGKALDLLNSKD